MQREYELVIGEAGKKFKTVCECKDRYAVFSSLITAIAECVKLNSLKSGNLRFSKEGETLNLRFTNDKKMGGDILIEMDGLMDDYPGTPYYSNWDGLFYRCHNHKKKPFIKNGQTIKRGQPVGIIFINKNEQFVLASPADGIISFPQGDAGLFTAVSINRYGKMDNNNPLFCVR